MKNRAKCKVCLSVLESFHTYDYVACKCGEISISGGNDRLECSAKDWKNFLRIDENGHEIMVKVQGEDGSPQLPAIMSENEKIEMLEAMIKNIENLPQAAMYQPVNQYDLFSFMVIILAILKDLKKS